MVSDQSTADTSIALLMTCSGEERPSCATCIRQGETCDYSIRLNWEGRTKKKEGAPGSGIMSFSTQPSPPKSSPQSPPILDGYTTNTGSTPSFHLPLQNVARPSSIANSVSPGHSRHGSQDQQLPSIAQFTSAPEQTQSNQNQHPSLPPARPVLKAPSWSDGPGMGSSMPSLASLSHLRASSASTSYPSPSDSNFGSPGIPPAGIGYSSQPNQMLPPMNSASQVPFQDSLRSPYNGAKRMRLSPRGDSLGRDSNNPISRPNLLEDIPRFYTYPSTPNNYFSNTSNPLTPAMSSGSALSGDPSDDRRISVSSLLSEDTSGGERRSSSTTVDPQPSRRGSLFMTLVTYSDTETYGHDRGNPDLDIPRNNDTQAISGASPSEHSDFDSWLSNADVGVPEFGFGLESRATVFAPGGYYASPVPIKIPCKLEPLPAALSENPMNLLYFHHFLNHTARILVPHDCPENPFKTILPKSRFSLSPRSVLR